MKKRKKEGGSEKGGENSPVSPPLDPRLLCSKDLIVTQIVLENIEIDPVEYGLFLRDHQLHKLQAALLYVKQTRKQS